MLNLGYLELTELLEKQEKDVPPEILNNIAVLYHLEAEAIHSFSEGNFQMNFKLPQEAASEKYLEDTLSSAESLYQQALQKLADLDSTDLHRKAALQLSIRYNVARLFECKGEAEKAEANYKDLLKAHPAFLDCELRV
jgi:RNA polymerase-associated protein CTR9